MTSPCCKKHFSVTNWSCIFKSCIILIKMTVHLTAWWPSTAMIIGYCVYYSSADCGGCHLVQTVSVDVCLETVKITWVDIELLVAQTSQLAINIARMVKLRCKLASFCLSFLSLFFSAPGWLGCQLLDTTCMFDIFWLIEHIASWACPRRCSPEIG